MAASTEVSIFGRVRKLLEGLDVSAVDSDVNLTLTQQLELLIAQGSTGYQELVRTGREVKFCTATAVAAAVAIPTTTGGLNWYNNEPDGGRSFVVTALAAVNAVSTAVVAQATLLALVGQVREAAPADAALAITKMNGVGPKVDCNISTLLTGTALPATTGLAANWFPVAPSVSKPSAVATPGYGIWAPIDGRLIIPPGRYGSIQVLANVVGETFQLFVFGHMKQITLA